MTCEEKMKTGGSGPRSETTVQSAIRQRWKDHNLRATRLCCDLRYFKTRVSGLCHTTLRAAVLCKVRQVL